MMVAGLLFVALSVFFLLLWVLIQVGDYDKIWVEWEKTINKKYNLISDEEVREKWEIVCRDLFLYHINILFS